MAGLFDKMTVLSLFDRTGNMVRPWAKAGYNCIIVDVNPTDRQEHNITRVQCDVLEYLPPLTEYKIVFAFPPCTHTAVSGAKHFTNKGVEKLGDSLKLWGRAERICKWTNAPYMIEHPVSVMSTHAGEPNHIFDPYMYAGYEGGESELYKKKTCLWTGQGFKFPEAKPQEAIYDKIHSMPESPDRHLLRSATPKGFAQAVYEANV